MRGLPGHNTRPHARLQPSFVGMDALMTSQLSVSLNRMVYLDILSTDLYNQALADVRSTVTGVRCFHCTSVTADSAPLLFVNTTCEVGITIDFDNDGDQCNVYCMCTDSPL